MNLINNKRLRNMYIVLKIYLKILRNHYNNIHRYFQFRVIILEIKLNQLRVKLLSILKYKEIKSTPKVNNNFILYLWC